MMTNFRSKIYESNEVKKANLKILDIGCSSKQYAPLLKEIS